MFGAGTLGGGLKKLAEAFAAKKILIYPHILSLGGKKGFVGMSIGFFEFDLRYPFFCMVGSSLSLAHYVGTSLRKRH